MERDALIAEIKQFTKRANIAPSTACLRAVGNPKLFARLEAGGACSINTAEKLRKWMQEWQPPIKSGAGQ